MSIDPNSGVLDAEVAVKDRYSSAALDPEAALCCPVDYDPRYLEIIPDEVLERDYGCGDPSRYCQEGDTVLDLGSGGGKICFIASQIVGPTGRVIGVDMNDEMLELARRATPVVAERLGFSNVEFRRARIQDLGLDLDDIGSWLEKHPVSDLGDLAKLQGEAERLRQRAPLVDDQSIDLVVSNCVLNLVRERDKAQLIREIFRVLKIGGRIAISDIVSDEVVPEHLKRDPQLWSGCISGAFTERGLLGALEEAGFYGIAIDKWESDPFAVVEGIEFRSVTVTARKGKEGPCFEANQAVVYAGPWRRVEDDDGHMLVRGERAAVCAKTYGILTGQPYSAEVIGIDPRVEVPPAERVGFDCSRTTPRHPRESKGGDYKETRSTDERSTGECC